MTDWRAEQHQSLLEIRADLYRRIREFMHARNILEVETPYLSSASIPDPNIHSLTTRVAAPGGDNIEMYLHTSPEFAMKRLLASGAGSVFQIARVFRNEESGSLHQPEFSMLEWYRPGLDYKALMNEVAELITCAGLANVASISYGDLYLKETGLNPHTCATRELQELAAGLGLIDNGRDRSELLDFIYNYITQAGHQKLNSFVYDYPVCQAALANIRQEEVPVAERFELFINGMEIANGFQELTDSDEQRQRFLHENSVRKSRGLPEVNLDEEFLAVLDSVPQCSGVALGLDRLLMCMTGSDNINDVIMFPHEAH
ncbi:MAG: EF-P lysine aminoacylase EpmA [Gammaproteobacteria bacterium]|nr:EF-P lysine aminoacylase EpmA [Gammaproteobacteria bacterium]